MSGISSVAPQQSYTPPQPTTQPNRSTGNTAPGQEGSGAPAPTTPNGRVVSVTA
jgi:hypothetical protein